MIYDVRHVTRYSYEMRVASSKLALRLMPRDGGGQQCIEHALLIEPQPRAISTERDFFGNHVTIASIDTGLLDLSIDARSRVKVDRPEGPASGKSPDWQAVAEAALNEIAIVSSAPVHYMFRSPRVMLSKDVTAYAAQSFHPSRPIADATRELAKRIRGDFKYVPESTEISTPLEQAFVQRSGVCQDFAHIMIAGLRGLGIPAAYVSGYIRTITAPGQKRLEGADASHAWVSVWCGREIGWLGIDPTNAIDVGNDHIDVAVGRDFSDVSPIHGVFVGSGETKLDVGVDVIPVELERV